MMNDERINYEMGNLKKTLLLIILSLGIIVFIIKLFYSLTCEIPWYLFITEVIAIISTSSVLIGTLFIKSDVKDEVYDHLLSNYYDKGFKVVLYIIFIAFALQMPPYIINANDNSINVSSNIFLNLVLFVILFFGYSFLRSKKIYFNANIIEEDNKIYYKGVFKNVLQIIKFFSIVYGCSIVVSLFYINNNLYGSMLLSIIIAYISSIFTNCIYYLFISLLEKIYYKEEFTKKISTATIVTLTIVFLSTIVYLFFSVLMYITNFNSGTIVAKLIYTKKYFQYLSLFFLMLGSVFFLNDINKDNEYGFLHKILYPLFFVILIEVLELNIYAIISKTIVNYVSYDMAKLTKILNLINTLYNIVLSLFYTIICTFVLIKYKNNKKFLFASIAILLINVFRIIISIITKKTLVLSFTIASTIILLFLFLNIVHFYLSEENKIVNN